MVELEVYSFKMEDIMKKTIGMLVGMLSLAGAIVASAGNEKTNGIKIAVKEADRDSFLVHSFYVGNDFATWTWNDVAQFCILGQDGSEMGDHCEFSVKGRDGSLFEINIKSPAWNEPVNKIMTQGQDTVEVGIFKNEQLNNMPVVETQQNSGSENTTVITGNDTFNVDTQSQQQQKTTSPNSFIINALHKIKYFLTDGIYLPEGIKMVSSGRMIENMQKQSLTVGEKTDTKKSEVDTKKAAADTKNKVDTTKKKEVVSSSTFKNSLKAAGVLVGSVVLGEAICEGLGTNLVHAVGFSF